MCGYLKDIVRLCWVPRSICFTCIRMRSIFCRSTGKFWQTSLPVAIFAGGPFGKGDEKEWHEVRAQFDLELAKFPWLTPISVEIVGGKFDPTKLRFPYNLIPALKKMPASDLRDWVAIRAWASSLAAQLLPDLSQ